MSDELKPQNDPEETTQAEEVAETPAEDLEAHGIEVEDDTEAAYFDINGGCA